MNVLTFHPAESLEENARYPPGYEPVEEHPAPTYRRLPNLLSRLVLNDLARQSLFSDQSFLTSRRPGATY